MNKRCLLLLALFSLFHSPLWGQSLGLMVKTYPIRYIYGMNGELTYTFSNRHQLSGFYQNHQRDWISIRRSKDPLGFSAFPRLISAEGHTIFLSYQFPLKNEHFWLGPKIGGKSIFATSSYIDEDGDQRSDWVDQDNGYLLGQLSFRNKLKGFIFEMYVHAGIVQITTNQSHFSKGDLRYTKDLTSYLPHILGGFSLGWGF